jgi:hypothetical protein
LGIFALVAAVLIMAGGGRVPHSIAVGYLGLPFSGPFLGSFDAALTISIVQASLTVILAVLLACRVPGVRWVLLVMSLLAAVHYAHVVVEIMSFLPIYLAAIPVIATLLWLVAGLLSALPATGRAMRGAKPRIPPPPMHGPPPVQGQWG